MMWTKIHDYSKNIGAGLFLVAVGMWTQSILDKSQKLPWLHQQAAILNKVQTVDIPKIKSVAGCQTVRAQIATTEVVQSENGADVDLSKIPNCPSLPPPKTSSKK